MNRNKLNLPVIAALAALVAASPLTAQGKGHGRGHGNQGRTEEVRRDRDRDDRDDDVRWERRRADERVSRRSGRRVPPGWCQGVGNPHNTRANCGYNTDRIYRDRSGTWRDRYGNVLRTDGIYRDRSGVLRDRSGRVIGVRSTTTSSTYDARHREFHRQLNENCYRSGSTSGRIAVSSTCERQHAAWHDRNGRR
jgi:hypothetical protein